MPGEIMSASSQSGPRREKELQRLLGELGPPVASFKPDMANFVAGIILAILAVAGGIALVAWMARYAITRGGELEWFDTKGKDELPLFLVGLSAFAGIAMVGLGVEFFLRARRVRFSRLFVRQHGFVAVEGRKTEVFRWDEVELVLEKVKVERLPLRGGLKYLLPLGQSYTYVDRRRDGREVELDR